MTDLGSDVVNELSVIPENESKQNLKMCNNHNENLKIHSSIHLPIEIGLFFVSRSLSPCLLATFDSSSRK